MFPTVLSANTPASGAYQISNSVRFRSAASAYLNRTPSVAGNQQKFTWSGWVKRGTLGGVQNIFGASDGSGNNECYIELNSDALRFYSYIGAYDLHLQTTAVYRDPSAWYHIVVVSDTTQATASNRAKIYVNGVQVTSFSITIYPSQNYNTYVNTTQPHVLGRDQLGIRYFDGYLADINFIDGQALTPSSFGQINPTTGVWQPIKYAGSYGTNGFHLAFNNGTSTTTLGNDSSGNGNNWTPNNISLTAGSTYDWMLDSPTPYAGSSYGVGNYAVLNAVASDGTVSNANLTVAWSGGNSAKPSTIGMSSGKWYCEIYMDSVGTAALPGLIPSTMIPTAGYPGSGSGNYGYYYDGQKYTGGAGSAYGASYTSGDVIGISFDADAGSLTFYKNGVSQGVAFSGIAAGTWFFAAGHSGTCTMSPNFGQRPFSYTPPSGYKTLCTQNLPAATIQNGAGYMAATLYTGTGAAQNIINANNNVSFTPDFVWIKNRSGANSHQLADSIRGATKYLFSDATNAEETRTNQITSFLTAGFSLDSGAAVNASANNYVAWQWKAGGTAVTNTAGSITSQVSANTTAGFSVVTYTGTGVAGATVGHGLGVAPSMVIAKGRGAVTSWPVYHVSLGGTQWLLLNAAQAATVSSQEWNNTNPTSSVFSIGNSSANDNQSVSNVAYCFAAIPGYSAFGSYTGNGSTDGPFVFTGMRSRFILIKRTDSAANWRILDTSRDVYNVESQELYPNLSNAEGTFAALDGLSNGFKLRNSDTAYNVSGGTYIYAAFAESPFSLSLAR